MSYPRDCIRCGGHWNAKIESPRYCPLCKSPYWNVPIRDQAKSESAKNQTRTSRRKEAAA